MAKTLTVTITVPLPDDHFEAADIMAGVKAPLETFKAALPDSAMVAAGVVTERKPRKAKEPKVPRGAALKPAAE
jgi:hypothetical protein